MPAADEPVRFAKDYRDLPASELTAAIGSQEVWNRRQARLALTMQARAGTDLTVAAAKLREQFQQPNDDSHAVQTFLTLHLIGASDEPFFRQQLSHRSEYVRAWAIRLLTEAWPIDDALGPVWRSQDDAKRIDQQARHLMPEFVRLAQADESALVRLALASTLQRLPVPLRSTLAKELVVHAKDASDHNLPLMIWYGLIPTVQFHAEELVEVAEACQLPVTLKYISRCLAEETEKQPTAINQLVAAVANSSDVAFQKTVLAGMSEGLRGWQRAAKPKSWDEVVKLDAPELAPLIRELSVVFGDGRAMDDVKEIALGRTDATPEVRLSALETLIQAEPDDLREICAAAAKGPTRQCIGGTGVGQI